jgi:hypothetical protein
MTTETTEYTIFVRTSDDVILDRDRMRVAEAGLFIQRKVNPQPFVVTSTPYASPGFTAPESRALHAAVRWRS